MIYTPEQLEAIEKYASIYMRPSDIAYILEVPIEAFKQDIHDSHNEACRVYMRGKATTKVALHAQEMALAKVGSPLALENARHNLLDMEDDE